MDVNEMVMGVPATLLYFRTGSNEKLIEKIMANAEYRKRGEVEEDPTFKQVIPYALLWEGIPKHSRIFVTHRVSAGDKRLAGKYSLGAGGHIRQPENVLSGMRRELIEEVDIDIAKEDIAVGFEGVILSDASEVDRVHAGLVYSVAAVNGLPTDLKCLEEELEGEWMTLDQVADIYDKLESWSQFVFNNLR